MQAIFKQLFELLQGIPATFWGVVFGSFLSLGGVTLTNRANDRRMRLQFEHDRMLRTKERDLDLRKEVYMAGAEAFHAGTLMIGNMANLDISQEKIEEDYRGKAPAIAKVQLIAGDKVMKAVAVAMGTLAELTVQLMGRRITLVALKSEIGQLEQLISGFSKTEERMGNCILYNPYLLGVCFLSIRRLSCRSSTTRSFKTLPPLANGLRRCYGPKAPSARIAV